MRITYQNGKLFINLRKDEAENVYQNIGTPTEIDIGNIVVLHEDIANIVKERLKEMSNNPEDLAKITGVSGEVGFTRISLTTAELQPFSYLSFDEKQIWNNNS